MERTKILPLLRKENRDFVAKDADGASSRIGNERRARSDATRTTYSRV